MTMTKTNTNKERQKMSSIKDGGSTALYIVYSVDTVFTVFIVYTIQTTLQSYVTEWNGLMSF